MFMAIGFELALCAILVITSGISLAIFMDTQSTSNIPTTNTNQGLVQIAQDNDNGSNDNDKKIEFLF